MPDIEKLLELVADLERFAPQDDALGEMIDRAAGDELELDELDSIAAAASRPDYARFLERVEARKRQKRDR